MRPTGIVFGIALFGGGLALQGCGDNHYWCGDGTTAIDGECVDIGSECGPGTHDEDGDCVLDDDVLVCGDGTEEVDGECVPVVETGLPPELTAVTSPTPYIGGGLMILEGDNFDLSDSGTLHVTVDGVETTNVMVLNNNFAVADLPASTVVTVEVGIENDLGDDAMDFSYQGLYATQGGGFGSDGGEGVPTFGPILVDAPELHFLDPRDPTRYIVLGTITTDGGTVARPVTAMKFDETGTLWAIEATHGDVTSALMTIDLTTGAATVVAELDPELPPDPEKGDVSYAAFPDMTFDGDTLYAWCEDNDDLTTIDTTTGAVTRIVSDLGTSGSGLVTLADGGLMAGFTSARLTVFGVDGVEVGSALFADEASANVGGLTWLDGVLYGVHSHSDVGVVRIDPATMAVQFLGGDVEYDAIAASPDLDDPGATPDPLDPPGSGGGSDLARLRSIAPDVDLSVHEVPAPAPRPLPVSHALRAADVFTAFAVAITVDERGRRGVALADAVSTDHVTIHAEQGEVTLDRDDFEGYRLVENQRGKLKLVDASGRPVLRRITHIEGN